jgi:hypothetical protein
MAFPHFGILLRSVVAVLTGILTVFVLSLGVDQVLHVMEVYPPWGSPMDSIGLNLLALAYRIPFNIAGAYVTAKLAPHSPLRHAMTYGWIGFGFSVVGTAGAIAVGGMGPLWYPVLLTLSAIPCAWAGGKLATRGRT